MWTLALQIIVPLFFATVIGFACAWQIRRHETLSARQECSEAQRKLEEVTRTLHAMAKHNCAIPQHSAPPALSKEELHTLVKEIEFLQNQFTEERVELDTRQVRAPVYRLKQAL